MNFGGIRKGSPRKGLKAEGVKKSSFRALGRSGAGL